MSLDEYREHVRKLATERSGGSIYNASVEHASIIVEAMFANAQRTVSILSSTFNARVYGRDEVIQEAKLFLASSHTNRLKIILESDSPRDRSIHPFFRSLSSYPNIESRVASEEVQALYDFHFLVMDEDSYRFEPDKKFSAALGVFGHPKGAGNLSGIFESLWQRCSHLDAVPLSWPLRKV